MYSEAGIEKSDSFSHQLRGGRNSSTHTKIRCRGLCGYLKSGMTLSTLNLGNMVLVYTKVMQDF